MFEQLCSGEKRRGGIYNTQKLLGEKNPAQGRREVLVQYGLRLELKREAHPVFQVPLFTELRVGIWRRNKYRGNVHTEQIGRQEASDSSA